MREDESIPGPACLTLMEVCGTHTRVIARSGLRGLLGPAVRLLSGPGCPVCVTSPREVKTMLWLARCPGVTMTTFGDMLNVPEGGDSLQRARAEGADVEVVYSPLQAVALARSQPRREVVFAGVGFETTAPAVALALAEAVSRGIKNFFLLSLHKRVAPAVDRVLSRPEIGVEGLICPGHVAIVTGLEPFRQLAERHGLPCVVAGFEPADVAEAVTAIIRQRREDRAEAEIQYRRAVSAGGNPEARRVMEEVFEPAAAEWRGLGTIPESGLFLRPAFAEWDAFRKWEIPIFPESPGQECRCGEVLSGLVSPGNCPLFGGRCTPRRPAGPCMVSQEGACAAAFRYGWAPGVMAR